MNDTVIANTLTKPIIALNPEIAFVFRDNKNYCCAIVFPESLRVKYVFHLICEKLKPKTTTDEFTAHRRLFLCSRR